MILINSRTAKFKKRFKKQARIRSGLLLKYMTRIETIQKFFETHKAIDKSVFAREAQISYDVLRRVLNGSTPRDKKDLDKIEERMRHYGFRDK